MFLHRFRFASHHAEGPYHSYILILTRRLFLHFGQNNIAPFSLTGFGEQMFTMGTSDRLAVNMMVALPLQVVAHDPLAIEPK
jgi:hypothetical protein